MLKHSLKRFVVVSVVAMALGQSFTFADDSHEKSGEKTPTETREKSPVENRDKAPIDTREKAPADTNVISHQVNPFSQYDALRERIEALSKIAPKEKKAPELIHGEPVKVRITPSHQQFSEGAEIVKRVKWYRERMAESCESSDKSAKMLGEFIDNCLTGLVFDSIKVDPEHPNQSAQHEKTTFELDAHKIRECRNDLNAYFEAKKHKLGDAEWKKHSIDVEINEKLTKFYNWYGAAVEGFKDPVKEQSDMIKEIGMVNAKNLCLIEEVKKPTAIQEVPKEKPKQATPTPQPQKPYQGPAQPSQDFKPPQVQNQPQPPAQQPQNPGYQPPQGGYNGPKYDPSGLGNGGKYKKPYDYENFKNYGDKNYTAPMYIPQMNYPKGSNYIPPSNNALPPRQASGGPIGGGAAPIGGVPLLGGRGFSLGLGFSNAYGYPYGMGMMPYGGYGGYGYPGIGYGGYMPGIGGIGIGGIGIGPGIIPGGGAIITPITPCGGLIGGCGGGCGGGLLNPISSCGGGCGGGLMNPLMPCGGNGMLYNPMNMYPGRMGMPRMPYGFGNTYNPMYNYGGMDPYRFWNPRNTGNNLQTVTPVNTTTPITTPVTNPITVTTPVTTSPVYTPVTNPIQSNPIRITLPRTSLR